MHFIRTFILSIALRTATTYAAAATSPNFDPIVISLEDNPPPNCYGVGHYCHSLFDDHCCDGLWCEGGYFGGVSKSFPATYDQCTEELPSAAMRKKKNDLKADMLTVLNPGKTTCPQLSYSVADSG